MLIGSVPMLRSEEQPVTLDARIKTLSTNFDTSIDANNAEEDVLTQTEQLLKELEGQENLSQLEKKTKTWKEIFNKLFHITEREEPEREEITDIKREDKKTKPKIKKPKIPKAPKKIPPPTKMKKQSPSKIKGIKTSPATEDTILKKLKGIPFLGTLLKEAKEGSGE